MKHLRVIKGFAKTQSESLSEEKFQALQVGDLIFVQLDKKQPEVRHFIGHGVRYKLADIRCFNLEWMESPGLFGRFKVCFCARLFHDCFFRYIPS
jgi:hypothetical protein